MATIDLISSPAKAKSENEAQGLTEQELEHLLERFASAYSAIAIRYGSITMSVERQPQGVVITELYHQYDKTLNHCEKRLYDHRLANSECTGQCRSFAGLAHSSLGNGTVLHRSDHTIFPRCSLSLVFQAS